MKELINSFKKELIAKMIKMDHNQATYLCLGKSLVLCILMTDGEVKSHQLPWPTSITVSMLHVIRKHRHVDISYHAIPNHILPFLPYFVYKMESKITLCIEFYT